MGCCGTFVLCTASSRCMRIDAAERTKCVNWVWGPAPQENLTPPEIINFLHAILHVLGWNLPPNLTSVSHCLNALKRCLGKCDSAMIPCTWLLTTSTAAAGVSGPFYYYLAATGRVGILTVRQGLCPARPCRRYATAIKTR